MRMSFRTNAVVALLLFTAACAKPPTQEMTEADNALNAAIQAGAEQYAAMELSAAQETLADARAKMESKDYKGAKMASMDAKTKADAATAAVDPNKQAAMAAAQERMTALKPEIESVTAEAAKIKGKTAEALKAEALGLTSLWTALDGDFAAGSYVAANARLDEAQEKLAALKSALEEAKAALKRKK